MTTPEHRIRLAAAAAQGRDLSALRRRLDVVKAGQTTAQARAEGIVSTALINAHASAERFRLPDERPCDCAECVEVREARTRPRALVEELHMEMFVQGVGWSELATVLGLTMAS